MKLIYTAVLLLVLVCSKYSFAQVLNPGKVLERKAINKTNQAINKKADEAIDSAFNKKNDPKTTDNKVVAQNNPKKIPS